MALVPMVDGYAMVDGKVHTVARSIFLKVAFSGDVLIVLCTVVLIVPLV